MQSCFVVLSLLTTLHAVVGLKVVIDYSFRLPDALGKASPSEAGCCPYVSLPVNKTGEMVPPSFFGIGAQKGGTTTMYFQLVKHPQLIGASKEMHYLDEAGSETYAHYLSQWKYNKQTRRQKGVGKTKNEPPKILFEFSPSYLFVPFSACKAKVIAPNGKFVVLLRDPVDRAYSGFTHAVNVNKKWAGSNHAWMKLTFWEAMEQGMRELMDNPRCDFQSGSGKYSYNDCLGCMLRWLAVYSKCDARQFVTITNRQKKYKCYSFGMEHVIRGLYGAQLAWWFTLFHPSQFIILNSQTYFKNPLEALKNITQFLNVQIPFDANMVGNINKKANVGSYKNADAIMIAETKSVLREYYRRPNLELYRLLGESGFPDFEPFESQFENVDTLDCNDPKVVEEGTCGAPLFTYDMKLRLGVIKKKMPVDQATASSNKSSSSIDSHTTKSPVTGNAKTKSGTVAPSKGSNPKKGFKKNKASIKGKGSVVIPKGKKKTADVVKHEVTTPTAIKRPVTVKETSVTKSDPKDQPIKGTSEFQIRNQSQKQASSVVKTSPLTDSFNRSVQSDKPKLNADQMTYNAAFMDPKDDQQRLQYYRSSDEGQHPSFEVSSSDRLFRSLRALVLIGMLIYIFRMLRRSRNSPRPTHR